MIELSQDGKPLTEWKRAFFWIEDYAPPEKVLLTWIICEAILAISGLHPRHQDDSHSASLENHQIVTNFLQQFNFEDDKGDPRRTPDQKHKVSNGIPLNEVYEQLLIQLRITRLDDSQKVYWITFADKRLS
ncbi:MAG: hypothetical protein H6633_34290 [Anaerolineales bacterium]|nr:hypothetical protein [Anaerolineales bacterium]